MSKSEMKGKQVLYGREISGAWQDNHVANQSTFIDLLLKPINERNIAIQKFRENRIETTNPDDKFTDSVLQDFVAAVSRVFFPQPGDLIRVSSESKVTLRDFLRLQENESIALLPGMPELIARINIARINAVDIAMMQDNSALVVQQQLLDTIQQMYDHHISPVGQAEEHHDSDTDSSASSF